MLPSLSMFHCEVKIQATVTSPYLYLCDGQDASMSMHRTLVLFFFFQDRKGSVDAKIEDMKFD